MPNCQPGDRGPGRQENSGRTQNRKPVIVEPGAVEEARASLEDQADTHARFARVSERIDGFESPFGLELLATVHCGFISTILPAATTGRYPGFSVKNAACTIAPFSVRAWPLTR